MKIPTMKQFIISLIKFDNPKSQQGVDRQPPKPASVITKATTQNRESLFHQPAFGSRDEKALRLFKALDLAG